jgi:hypothetical protein
MFLYPGKRERPPVVDAVEILPKKEFSLLRIGLNRKNDDCEKNNMAYYYPHTRPFRLKKNFSAHVAFSEEILPEKNIPTTFLLISPGVG